MTKENVKLNNKFLHKVVNFSTFGTILAEIFKENDFENFFFTCDTYYSHLFDNKLYMEAIGDVIEDVILKELIFGDIRVDVKVGAMYKPTCYHYSKDEIDIVLTLDINKLTDYMVQFEDEFDEFLFENYSSRSSLAMPFMPNSYEKWLNEQDNDKFVACAINFLHQKFNYRTVDNELIYNSLVENYYVFDFINDTDGALLDSEVNHLNDQINSGAETSVDLGDYTYLDNTKYIDTYISQERAKLAKVE